jgi:hypothetical protein
MRKIVSLSFIFIVTITFLAGQTLATKPGQDVNPNGFPSGEHYNLNIIGKKTGFTCPEQEYDENGNPIYGNVVFVPENGKGIKIYMESGKGGKAEAITELRVIDWCAGFDGDGATIQLPKNEAGYRVYARALAKPTDNPDIKLVPSLVEVLDENGNDLIYLGLVKDGAFQRSDETIYRTKGKSKATDISALFKWSGLVCYLSPTDVNQDPSEYLCCVDRDSDGVFDECVEPTVLADGTLTCFEGELVPVYCEEYVEEWVFNIGDFVTYLWSADNNGVKLLQVRFYPN